MTDLAPRHRILWALLVIAIGAVGVAYVVQRTRKVETPTAPPTPDVRGTVRPFTLTERSGKEFDGAALKGKVWIAHFMFTLCPGPCPLMCLQVSGLQKTLPEEVQFVSFSIDPVTDTPEVLRGYAVRFNAQEGRWWFVTGPRETIWRISEVDFKVGVKDDPDDPRRPDHDPRFCVVDRRGRVRGHYRFDDEEQMRRLSVDVPALLKEK